MSQNGSVPNNDRESLRKAALEYHEFPVPGKLSVTPTKQLTNQRDLALAYSPGVAASSEEIVADPVNVFRYTARGNLVAVITDGTAVLGLGAIGPLAAKPVMEGKAVLFKEFACACAPANITPSSLPRTTTVTTNIGPPIKRCRRGAASRLSTRAWKCVAAGH
jgi:malic enzyme